MTYPPNDVPAFVFWLMPDEDPVWEEWPHSNPLYSWARGRCAMCQVDDNVVESLVMDHDHTTGKVRGPLCRSCNTQEGTGTSPALEAWRAGLNPAAVLGYDEFYYSPVTGKAKPETYEVSDEYLDAMAEVISGHFRSECAEPDGCPDCATKSKLIDL